MSRPTGGLGRGLGALIPSAVEDPEERFREIPLELIDPNPYQPRKHFDEEAIESLTASIRELGVLQPILVRPTEDGRYELIAGERRWRCARRAGLAVIPALLRAVDDETSLAEAVVENIHRQDLNPLEESAAYRQLLEDFDLTHEELATRVGKSRTAVTNALRLLQLPIAVQRRVMDGSLSAGHARALLGLTDREGQERLAAIVIEEGWSVRATEDAVRAEREPAPEPAESPADRPAPTPSPKVAARDPRPAAVLELEELLSEHLSTNVAVQLSASGRGRVVVEFADIADLQRVAQLLHPEL